MMVFNKKVCGLFFILALLALDGFSQFAKSSNAIVDSSFKKLTYILPSNFSKYGYNFFETKSIENDTENDAGIEIEMGYSKYLIKGEKLFITNRGYLFNNFDSSKFPYKKKQLFFTEMKGRYGKVLKMPTIKESYYNIDFNYLTIYRFREHGSHLRYSFNRCDIGSISVIHDTLNYFRISHSKVADLYFENVSFDTLSLQFGSVESINFSSCDFLKMPFIYLDVAPKSLDFSYCNLNHLNGILDLNRMFPSVLSNGKRCLLSFIGTDISKLRFDYSNFEIDIGRMNVGQRQTMYKALKDQYFKFGMSKSLELVDIDLKDLEYQSKGWLYRVEGWINKHWWLYGYDKVMVLTNSFIIFIVFLLLNLIIKARRLVSKGYAISGFDEVLQKNQNRKGGFRKSWLDFVYTLLFTILIFWGIHLDKKEIKYTNLGYTFYILFQYSVGVVCLAYVAAFILSK